jgi:hypothetical protein
VGYVLTLWAFGHEPANRVVEGFWEHPIAAFVAPDPDVGITWVEGSASSSRSFRTFDPDVVVGSRAVGSASPG